MKLKALLVLFLLTLSILSFAEEAKVTLTGKVNAFNRVHPVLVSEGKEYLLMIPRFFELKEGEEITIEGYIVDKDRFRGPYNLNNNTNFSLVFVSKLTADGKTYDTDDFRGCPGYGNLKERGSYPYHKGRGYRNNNRNKW